MEKIRVLLDPQELNSLMHNLKDISSRKANFRRWKNGTRNVPIELVEKIFVDYVNQDIAKSVTVK